MRIVLFTMIRPRAPPEELLLFQQLVARATSNRSMSISDAEYQQLERTFIAAQGPTGSPAVFWGWGHQRLLRDVLAAVGVRAQ